MGNVSSREGTLPTIYTKVKVGNRCCIGEQLLCQAKCLSPSDTVKDSDFVAFQCRENDEDSQRVAHRAILKATSGYFRDLMDKEPGRDSFTLPVSAAIFDLVLEFIYTKQEIQLNVEQALPLLAAAQTFRICDLPEQVIAFIKTCPELFIEFGLSDLCADDIGQLAQLLPELCVDRIMQLELAPKIHTWVQREPGKRKLGLELLDIIHSSASVVRIISLDGHICQLGEIKDKKFVTIPSKILLSETDLIGVINCVMNGRELFVCQADKITVIDVLAATFRIIELKKVQGITLFENQVYAWTNSALYMLDGANLKFVVKSLRSLQLVEVSILSYQNSTIDFVALTSKNQLVRVSYSSETATVSTEHLGVFKKLVGASHGSAYAFKVKSPSSSSLQLVALRSGSNMMNIGCLGVWSDCTDWYICNESLYQVRPTMNSTQWKVDVIDMQSKELSSLTLGERAPILVPSSK